MSSELAYYLMGCGSCIYLLYDFSFELRKLIKAFIASQIIGDMIFAPWLSELPVYRFMTKLETSDRFYALLVVLACVALMDAGFALIRPPRRSVPLVSTLYLRRTGGTFVLIALLCKLTSLAAAGVLFHPLEALSLQPEALVGASFLDVIGSTLLPMGLAFWVLSSDKRRHGIALCCVVLFGMFSPWKGDIVRMAACYIFALGLWGWQFVREAIIGRHALLFCVGVMLFLPIKTQLRSDAAVSLDPPAFATYLVMGTSGRATGGIFQTFAEAARSIRDHSSHLMGGRYNLQAAYLWVPRMLWPDKPRVAAEQVYDYLDLSEESYGTSFAVTVFGTFYLDFGLWGCLLCSFALGLMLSLAERWPARYERTDPIKSYAVAALILSVAFNLGEAGIPPVVSQLLACTVVLFAGLKIAKWASVPTASSHYGGVEIAKEAL